MKLDLSRALRFLSTVAIRRDERRRFHCLSWFTQNAPGNVPGAFLHQVLNSSEALSRLTIQEYKQR